MISQNRIVIGRGWWLGRCMSTGTNSVIRRINSESLIYSMVTTVNIFQILYTWKLLRQQILSVLTTWRVECVQIRSDQSLSRVRLFATPWIAARQASLSITNSQSSLRLTSIKSVMPSNHLILCRPLLLLPPIPPSITVFSNESTLCMRWPKYWSFSFSVIPSKEHSLLISWPQIANFIGEGNGNPLQCSCLENPIDRGVWWAIACGIAKSWTRLSN